VQGDRKARAAAARKAAQAAEKRRRVVVTSAAVAVVVVVVGVLIGVSLAGGGDSDNGTVSSGSSGGGQSANVGKATKPPWPAPTGPAADKAIASSGLKAFGQEMLDYHIHAHLDVIDDGKPVTVPPGIGYVYDDSGQPKGLTSLHTHQTDGIIHIEAQKPVDYRLGQFFKEWAVPLSAKCVGALCADSTHTLGVYVNGKKVSGDPNDVVIHKHDEIAVIYAKKGSSVKPPSSFDFPSGL
jgi:hypothetical protein